MTNTRALVAVLFAPLFGCGQQMADPSVGNRATVQAAPVVIQSCDEECKRVAQHRENQRRKGLDSAF